MAAWTESPPMDWWAAAEHGYKPESSSNKKPITSTDPTAPVVFGGSAWERAVRNTIDMGQQMGV